MSEEPKPAPNPFDDLTSDERAAALRAQLFQTHKARGSLGAFYRMYSDLAPPPRPRERDDGGRER